MSLGALGGAAGASGSGARGAEERWVPGVGGCQGVTRPEERWDWEASGVRLLREASVDQTAQEASGDQKAQGAFVDQSTREASGGLINQGVSGGRVLTRNKSNRMDVPLCWTLRNHHTSTSPQTWLPGAVARESVARKSTLGVAASTWNYVMSLQGEREV